ncbi:unnamed protein product [Meganyctiphanes norvegica]|uniref:Fibrinogen C-terminal domain-containing protein n=1 Tax=Meganyctiphanes norvegica TaxID=48144 RepID=A0AAV2RHN9_MEGNR
MKTMLILLFSALLVTSGYAENVNEQIQNFKSELFDVLSELSGKIDTKVDTIKSEMIDLKLQFGSKIDNIQSDMINMKLLLGRNDINEKISLLPTQIIRMAINMGTSISESVGHEVKDIEKKITLAETKMEQRLMTHFEDMNSTMKSLETKLIELSENISISEEQEKLNMMNSFINISEGFTGMKNIIHNVTTIQQENIIGSIEANVENIVMNFRSVNNSIETGIENMGNNLKKVNEEIISVNNKIESGIDNITNNISSVENACSSFNPKITSINESIIHLNDEWTNIFNNVSDGIKDINSEIGSTSYKLESGILSIIENISSVENTCKVINPKMTSINKSIISINEDLTLLHNNISDGIIAINSDIKLQSNLSNGEMADINSNLSGMDLRLSMTLENIKDGVDDLLHPWTIIQKRRDVEPREDFNRPWADYVQGFGKFEDGEYWEGLEKMHKMTSDSKQELYITLQDWEGNKRWAKYSTFYVGPPEDNYRLKITGYTGDSGDAMARHNGQAFSTYDRDNDASSSRNCAEKYKGGWWWSSCGHARLNGLPNRGTDTPDYHGIIWKQWKDYDYSLKSVTMKIRPSAAP